MKASINVCLSLSLSLLAVGCGGGAPAPSAPTTGTAPAATKAPASLDEQVQAGAATYGAQCASCHGASGEGKAKAPAVVGPKTLGDYKDAREAFEWIKGNMPPDSVGSLPDQEYWNVVAFLVKKNDIAVAKVVGPDTAGEVKLSR